MKKLILTVLLVSLAFFVVACGNSDNKDAEDTTSGNDNTAEEANNSSDNAANNADQEETSGTLTVEHELGETDVPVNPEKVVVFDLGILDTVDKLGIEVAGLPQKILPEYLEKYGSDDYANVGSLKEPDFEKISEIDPDLIIISGRQSSVYDQLSELAPTVYLGVDSTRYMDSFKENMQTVGKIFDKEDEIQEELDTIDQSIADLNEKAEQSDENGLVLLANDDKISAYGSNSRFGIIHDVFGVKPADEDIEASTHGMNVSFEYVMEQNPDKLYVIDRTAAISDDTAAKQIVENQLVQNTDAYKNDDITYLSPDVWYLSGGGLQSVSMMIDEVAASFK
ncbi:Ferric anguibactin-binding protein [Lentibacillus sp. JNUCC-1]|uniref:siderophore ABC transporter substrate-binding protein n=1 Tax=Lentibacillus sp. JNUCC-1 TaxID=2654513 RepID=UPI0012E749D3|nr:siderophore ABC transporter substrate-binding protein [Lentibacillus sp. JNUCC-1]MUV38436.1 Ferric anguibactin-binding protein [Lentibacillus sp. JNUCC-1]